MCMCIYIYIYIHNYISRYRQDKPEPDETTLRAAAFSKRTANAAAMAYGLAWVEKRTALTHGPYGTR